jgi:hypothetical protein
MKNKLMEMSFFFDENSPFSTLKKGSQKVYCELK